MEIIILGSGCASCDAIFTTTKQLVEDLSLKADVKKEENLDKIMEYNIRTLPAIVIDGKVVAKGKLSSKDIRQLLASYQS